MLPPRGGGDQAGNAPGPKLREGSGQNAVVKAGG